MSRIGNAPIPLPKGVSVDITGSHVQVKGAKGTLEREILASISLEKQDGNIVVRCNDNSRRTRAFSGMTRSLVNNMVVGVDKGFQKKLSVEGVGYRAEVKGNTLVLSVGYSKPVDFNLPAGVTAEVDKAYNITLSCIDKELLGLTAAQVRDIRKPEPYKGKGIRYADEYIAKKVGKAAGK
jgi:large subunit ribosomal protein L6